MSGTNVVPLLVALAGILVAFLGGFYLSQHHHEQTTTADKSFQPRRLDAAAEPESEIRPGKLSDSESGGLKVTSQTSGNLPTLRGHLKPLGSHREPSVHIDELQMVPSSQDFYRFYVRPRRAVVLRGAARSWPAFEHWGNEDYLRRNYGDTMLKVEKRKRYDNEQFVKTVMNLSDFLDAYRTEELYMDSPYTRSDLPRDILVPECLLCPELLGTVTSTHLLFSNGNTSSSLHHDGFDNFLALLSGKKTAILIDSQYSEEVYANDYITYPGLTPIEPDSVDLEKFPRLKDAPYAVVNLEPGDILYIPMYMYHHIRSHGSPNIGANIWFYPFNFDEKMQQYNIPGSDVAKQADRFNELIQRYAPLSLECQTLTPTLESVLKLSAEPDDFFDPDEIEEASAAVSSTVLLSSGYRMPVIGFGTSRAEGDTAVAAIKSAIKIGYRLIDTAQSYDEKAVGQAVAESGLARADLFIVTKVHPRNNGYRSTLESIKQSLKDLRTDYIDLVLIHATECEPDEEGAILTCPNASPGPWQGTWRALEKAHNGGTVRSIGVSNFETVSLLKELVEIATVPVSVVQNYFEMFHTGDAVRVFCKQHRIQFMGYGILGAVWMDEGAAKNPILNNDFVLETAYSRQCTAAQVVLRWAMQMGVAVLARSLNPVHMEINLHSMDIHLNDREMNALATLSGQKTFGDMDDDGQGTDRSATPSVGVPMIVSEPVVAAKMAVFAGSDDGRFTAFNGSDGHVHWQFKTFNEFGSTCVFTPDGHTLVFSTEDKHVYALDVSTGNVQWHMTDAPGEGFVATPSFSVHHDAVFVGSLSGVFFRIDAGSGEVQWFLQRDGEIWSTAAVAVVDGVQVVFFGTASEGENFFAVSSADGAIRWSKALDVGVWASPALSRDKVFVYVASQGGTVYCLKSSNGKVVWKYSAGSEVKSSPVISHADGAVYAASVEGRIFALNVKNGKELWRYEASCEVISTVSLAPGGLLVVGLKNNRIQALKRNGTATWHFETRDEVWSTAAVGCDGSVFVGSLDGSMYALTVSDGSLVWQTKVASYAASPCLTPQHRCT